MLSDFRLVRLLELFIFYSFIYKLLIKLPGISCNEPLAYPNTEVQFDMLLWQSLATYDCVSGYKYAEGDMERFCQDDKTWNGTALLCQGIQMVSPTNATSLQVY